MKASSLAIAAVSLAAAIASFPAEAADVGPARDVAAIQHDVPILLSSQLQERAIVDDVVVQNDAAIATWRSGTIQGIAGLHWRHRRWWASGSIQSADGKHWQNGSPFPRPAQCPYVPRPFAWVIPDIRVSQELLAAATASSPLLQAAQAVPSDTNTRVPIDCFQGLPEVPVIDDTGAYSANLKLVRGSRKQYANVFLRMREPTDGEMPPTPNVNSYAFLYLKQTIPVPDSFTAGSTLDVWFPFALAPTGHYTLRLGFVTPDIDGLPGTLQNNVLHFELPAFALTAGKEAIGEIDGDFP